MTAADQTSTSTIITGSIARCGQSVAAKVYQRHESDTGMNIVGADKLALHQQCKR